MNKKSPTHALRSSSFTPSSVAAATSLAWRAARICAALHRCCAMAAAAAAAERPPKAPVVDAAADASPSATAAKYARISATFCAADVINGLVAAFPARRNLRSDASYDCCCRRMCGNARSPRRANRAMTSGHDVAVAVTLKRNFGEHCSQIIVTIDNGGRWNGGRCG